MPYSRQHLKEKTRIGKKKSRKGFPCPCAICSFESTQSENVIKRHLETFGRCDSGLLKSDTDEEIINLDLAGGQRDDIGNNLPDPSSSDTDETVRKRRRTTHVNNKQNDHDCEREQLNIDRMNTCTTSDDTESEKKSETTGQTNNDSSEMENSSPVMVEENTDLLSSSHSSGDHEQSIDEYSSSSSVTYNFTSDSEDDTRDEQSIGHDVYATEKANLPLFEDSELTVLQALAGYFQWFTEHPSTSKSALSDLLRLQQRLLPQPNNLPQSYDEAYNFVKPFLLPFETYHVCSNDCVVFRKTSRYDYSKLDSCPVCGTNRYSANKKAKRTFIYYPLGPRWRRMYGSSSISEVLQSHYGHEEAEEKVMRDIHDSSAWKQAFSAGGFSSGDPRGMLLQLSTDGVNPFSSNKVSYSMWPIMLSVLNLPRNIRNLFQNIMLAGIVPAQADGHEPKHIDPYLEVVVDEILDLSGATFCDAYKSASFNFKVAVLSYVLDYPGLGKVFTAAGPNALQGCMWCEIRGKYVACLDKVVYLENRRFLPNDHPLRRQKKWFPDQKPEKRSQPEKITNEDLLWNAVAHNRAKNKTQASNVTKATGSRGVNCFMLLPNHDRTKQAFPDMMHDLKNIVCAFFDLFTGKGDSVKVRNAEKDLGRFKGCWYVKEKNDDIPEKEQLAHDCEKMASSKKGRKKTQKSQLPAAPFLLSSGDLKLADKRAMNVFVPVGYGWKPGPLFCKKPYLKSHDWKQLAVDGILKFCLRGLLGESQRKTFFHLLDVIRKVCSDFQDSDTLPSLEKEINEVCAEIERDFPISVQTISLHIFRHSVPGIQQFGPVHSWWMYCYERFNSWICQRVKNRRFPEATVMQTYRIFDWVQYMSLSGQLPSIDVNAVDEYNAQSHPKGAKSSNLRYQLTTQEVKDLNVHCGNALPLDHALCCIQFFSIEKKVHGKSYVWKAQNVDSSVTKHVSSVVQVHNGRTKHVGRVIHFLTLQGFGINGEFATIEIFDVFGHDPDSCLHFVNTSSSNVTTVPFEFLSVPLVTALDDDEPFVWWLLNI